MHEYDYKTFPEKLLTPEIVSMLTTLHEYKGRQEYYLEAKPDILTALVDAAKIRSTGASNRIEGIFTNDNRLAAIVKENAAPTNRSEAEIAGYKDVLATIHESHDSIPITPNVILQLHRNLFSFTSASDGGKFKNADNLIMQIDKSGIPNIRFVPVPAFETPEAVENLCSSFNATLSSNALDPLLLTQMFVFDFLCIHPFNDGNGRLSRLLTLLLLYQCGYVAGKYISIESIIEDSKETYYKALKASSTGWSDSQGDYIPFITYSLGVIIKAYREFEDRVADVRRKSVAKTITKSDRIKAFFDKKPGKITKADILSLCPDISQTTVERTLSELLTKGYIEKSGRGRATYYKKVVNLEG
jgi:Uncharacterized conserved protein